LLKHAIGSPLKPVKIQEKVRLEPFEPFASRSLW
jgi:hypothetical protein